jgi:hypothetical protein
LEESSGVVVISGGKECSDLAELNRKNESKESKKAVTLQAMMQEHKVKIATAVVGVLVLALVAGFATGMIGPRNPGPGGDSGIALAQANNGNENAEALPKTTRAYGDPFMIGSDSDPFAGPMKLVGVVLCGKGNHLAIIEAGGTAYVVARGQKIAGYWTVLSIQQKAVELRSDDKEMTLQLVDR